MGVFFQCLGITGGILIFYGLLAFAVTRASTGFFWTLLVSGLAFLLVFVITALNRTLQAIIALLVFLNAPWIILALGKAWPPWVLWSGIAASVVVTLLIGQKRAKFLNILMLCVLYTGSYAALVFMREKSWYGYGVLGVAFLLNGVFLYLARLYLRDYTSGRSLRYGASAVVYTIIFLAIVAVANVISQDFHVQKDFTENKINTLTEQSIKIIEALTSPLKFTAFFDDRSQAKPAVKELLEMYQFKSKKVEVKFVDPDKDKLLAEKHAAKDGDVLVEYEEQNHLTQSTNEEGITQAIIKVIRSAKPTVCFTKGHGELDIDGSDEEPRSLSAVKGGLQNEGYQTKAVEALVENVPVDCAIVVVAGPTQQFTKAETDSLDRFLTNGGHVFLMLDPNIPDAKFSTSKLSVLDTGFEGLAKKWGVELGKNFILEKHLELFKGVTVDSTVRAQNYGNHPIVDPLKGRHTVFDRVRSIQKVKDFSGTTVELVSSSGNKASWAQADVDSLFRLKKVSLSAQDIHGPVPFGFAVEKELEAKDKEAKEKKKTKLVIIGDSDFASNGMVRGFEFNYDFFLNALNWMAGQVEQISIRPKQIRTSALELTPQQSNMIFYVAIIGLPMLVLIFGMDLWWYRRRKG